MKVCISLACFPGLKHAEAAVRAHQGLCEPLFGDLKCDHIQLVPQSCGMLDERNVSDFLEAFPSTRFRLHANVRVLDEHIIADLSTFELHTEWFEQAARLSRQMQAPAYSLHSGRRAHASMQQMLDNISRVQDLFECVVAVEGQYPDKTDSFLVSTWREYAHVLDSGVAFALDLSHLNILSYRTKTMEMGLVKEMLASESCIEVHVSGNDGFGDQHQVAQDGVWWQDLLSMANPDAVIFSEGNHRNTRGLAHHAASEIHHISAA